MTQSKIKRLQAKAKARFADDKETRKGILEFTEDERGESARIRWHQIPSQQTDRRVIIILGSLETEKWRTAEHQRRDP